MFTSDTFASHPTDPSPAPEVINGEFPRGPFRAALFDFDGTISLVRRGWQDVMIPMMVEHLVATKSAEAEGDLRQLVEDFVARLTGRQTIYQMIQLTEEVAKRGGAAKDPLEYKHEYHKRLWAQVGGRVAALQRGELAPDELLVPGTIRLLDLLRNRGVALYLASGTDLAYVRDEAAALGVAHYFGQHIYGALDDYKKFSKAMIIQQMLRDMNVAGKEVVGFGDGFVELEEVKRVGGLAIGVATNEETRQGVNQWKRARLIEAGADVIVGDYRRLDDLVAATGL